MKKLQPLLIFLPLAVIALDQITKVVVSRILQLHETVPVIRGLFNLVHLRNRGIAFGLLNRPGNDYVFYLLTIVTIGAVLLMLFWFTRLRDEDRRIKFGLSLIIGGAVGNLIDRLRLNEVIDFLDFHIGPYHWPAFNVADSAITVGTIWLAVTLILEAPAKPQKA
ncbi:MAG: signal peptidase II [Pseudomonadota bacterium]